MLRTFLLCLALLSGGCASTGYYTAPQHKAYAAAVADTAISAVNLSGGGFVELNPAGLLGATVGKGIFLWYAAKQTEPDRTAFYSVGSTFWGAASVVGLLGHVVAPPAAMAAGVVAGYALWRSTAADREFAQACAVHIAQFKMDPATKCERGG